MRNSSLVKRFSADNTRDLNIAPKQWTRKSGRGAFCMQRRFGVSRVGAYRKEDVGISNDNAYEKYVHRKSKVS